MAFVRYLILVGAIASVASSGGTGKNLRVADTDRWFESLASRYDPEPPPEPLSLPISRKLSDLEEAYLDSYTILKERNSCSEFFGGPQAIEALNELTKQIQPAYLDRRVGLRMTGQTMKVLNFRTGFR